MRATVTVRRGGAAAGGRTFCSHGGVCKAGHMQGGPRNGGAHRFRVPLSACCGADPSLDLDAYSSVFTDVYQGSEFKGRNLSCQRVPFLISMRSTHGFWQSAKFIPLSGHFECIQNQASKLSGGRAPSPCIWTKQPSSSLRGSPRLARLPLL